MKSTDLRLGNLILLHGFPRELTKQMFKIAVITTNCEGIKPVKISVELLLNFGFKTRITIGHSVQYFIGENPVTHDWLFDILWIKGDDYPFYRNGHFKIKTVHQLQNLFHSLTGQELEFTSNLPLPTSQLP
jgi:hypothetical protein